MKQRNVLVFPAGTEIGLEIFHSLNSCKEVILFGAGQDTLNHAKFIYTEYQTLPSIYEDNWVNELVNLCKKNKIDYIFPAYDDIVVALSHKREIIPARIISSPSLTCDITRSKLATYKYLEKNVRTPVIYETTHKIIDFPVFVKPDKGQGSFGVAKVDNHQELSQAVESISNPIVCEYLPGEEFTVDCFSDREKGLIFCGTRRRRRMRNGISVNTITEDIPETKLMAEQIAKKLVLHGAWFFQVRRAKDGELVLLEVAPRIAGSMAAHRVKGINFPLLSIFEEERLPLSIQTIPSIVELDRALSNRYKHSIRYSTLYIDLDDTLIINGKINIQALALVFKCINEKKKIVLITRHHGNLENTLQQHRLSGLFDEIIHVKNMAKKSSFIKGTDAIFVEDSFSERMDVYQVHNIPTFDCSMIELLIN